MRKESNDMRKITVRIILLVFVTMIGMCSCAKHFNLNTDGFSDLVKNIEQENSFITNITMLFSGTPANINITCDYNDEKSLEEIIGIKDQLTDYLKSDQFIKSIESDSRFPNEWTAKTFRYSISFFENTNGGATPKGGYSFGAKDDSLDDWGVTMIGNSKEVDDFMEKLVPKG